MPTSPALSHEQRGSPVQLQGSIVRSRKSGEVKTPLSGASQVLIPIPTQRESGHHESTFQLQEQVLPSDTSVQACCEQQGCITITKDRI